MLVLVYEISIFAIFLFIEYMHGKKFPLTACKAILNNKQST